MGAAAAPIIPAWHGSIAVASSEGWPQPSRHGAKQRRRSPVASTALASCVRLRATRTTTLLAPLLPRALREGATSKARTWSWSTATRTTRSTGCPALARELVAERVDLIFAITSGAARAAKEATLTIPIVFYGNFDPIAIGLVKSLAQPGGNTTGILIAPDGTLAAKRMELLKQAVPGTKRIAVLFPDDINTMHQQRPEAVKAARELRVELVFVDSSQSRLRRRVRESRGEPSRFALPHGQHLLRS